MVRFALASPALMLERQGILAALRRSAKLVRGCLVADFGILRARPTCSSSWSSILVSIPFGVVAVIADGTGISELLRSGGPGPRLDLPDRHAASAR